MTRGLTEIVREVGNKRRAAPADVECAEAFVIAWGRSPEYAMWIAREAPQIYTAKSLAIAFSAIAAQMTELADRRAEAMA